MNSGRGRQPVPDGLTFDEGTGVKATRIHGPKDVRLDEIESPPAPGPYEILIAPTWCGLCGSDLKGYLGNGIGAEGPMRVMGHEFAGVIVGVGAGLDEARVGERVCVMPLEHCGRCIDCQRGDFNLCADKSFVGLYGPSALGGGLGDLVVVKDYQAIPLEGLTDEQGALVEPAAVALHAVIEAGVGPGHTVLVVGCGAIGSLVVLAAQAAGAAVVVASEPNPGRAELAMSFGAVVLDPGTRSEQMRQIEATIGISGRVDIAFDCAGKEGALELCIDAIKTGGRICIVAGRKNAPPIDVGQLQQLPASIIGSLAYTQHSWDRTLGLIRAGKFAVERTVTSRIARPDIVADGFEALLDPTRRELKILVRVDPEGDAA
jgi:(R,R)-butanediol dehydrogenase / meso-butanediol dehydrogenase / diacetyl reductase